MAKRFATNMSDAVKPDGPKGRLIGYARVSTAEQSLDLQINALTEAGVHPDNLHVEKVSGVSSMRHKLDACIMDARPGDTILVWRLDRFGRSMLDLLGKIEELNKRGVGFRTTQGDIDTTTANGRLILHIYGALAEFERNLIIERTKAGVKAAKARGVKFGRERALTDEQIRNARAMLKAGQSVRSVAKYYGVTTMTIYKWAKRPAKR